MGLRTKVRNCARCGRDHEMDFYEFSEDPIDCDGVVYTHWGYCPNTNEPVLLRVLDEENVNDHTLGAGEAQGKN